MNFNTVEKVGGSSSVALSLANIPIHTHAASSSAAGNHTHGTGNTHHFTTHYPLSSDYTGRNRVQTTTATASRWSALTARDVVDYISAVVNVAYNGNHSHTINIGNAGSGAGHTNLQPYITCYMWKRIA